MLSLTDIRTQLMSYRDYVQLGVSPPYVVEGSCDGGELVYYGAAHSWDPRHPKVADLCARFTQARPELALTEGGWPCAGPPLRLLVAGDSSAAGVGAPHQDAALAARIAAMLASDFEVDWRLEATTGHTTEQALARLRHLDGSFDVAVTALGVNDTARLTSPRRFARHQRMLMDRLTKGLGVRLVIATAVPPMQMRASSLTVMPGGSGSARSYSLV